MCTESGAGGVGVNDEDGKREERLALIEIQIPVEMYYTFLASGLLSSKNHIVEGSVMQPAHFDVLVATDLSW